jgi:hypothetical protein
MKKRIQLFIMIFSISLINAQTIGDTFTTDDIHYKVTSVTPNEVEVENNGGNNQAYPNATLVIPATVSDGVNSFTVTVIAAGAFAENGVIKYVTINATNVAIGLQSFRKMPLLETIDMSAVTAGSIGARTFWLCPELLSIDATNFVGTVANDACVQNVKLTTVNFNSLVTTGNNMFLNCTGLKTAHFNSLVAAGYQMFKNCTSLTTVNLNSLVTIGYQGFFNCPSLVSIDLPLLTATNNRAFEDCTSLKYINLPSLVTLNQGTFYNTGLESIVFPATFTTFEGADTHFQNSTLLKHIGFASSTPIPLAGAHAKFTGIASNPVIVVPSGSAAAYDTEAGWTDFSIVEGTLSKTATDITYSRNLSVDDDWFLISSPVNDEMYNDAYVTANNIDATGSVATNNAIATYITTDNTWSYMQDTEDLPFTPGIGFSVKREDAASAGDISFTGSDLNKGDITGVPVSTDTDGFNLLGNPYLTNINSGAFLTANANLDGQIWLYDQAEGNYITHITGVDKILAPAQGFFVKAASGTVVNFTTAIQTNSEIGVFQKTSKSEIKLLIKSNDTERFAKIFFTASATTGFDKGWDGERFTGLANKMDVFTQLLEGNTGKDYQVQSLPMANIEATVVPVGLIAEAGNQITFSAETLNIPANLKVFLEDRQENTFTRLDEVNTKYEVTLSDKLDGTGRFFVHTSTNSVLSIDSTILEGVSVYKLNASTLKIVGLSQGKATVKLFNVLGKQMMKTSFETSGSDEISLSNLATGIYIVQLETENGKLNKKIILE